MIKVIIDLVPVVAFFVVYKMGGIMPAVIALMILTPLMIVVSKVLKQPVNKVQYAVAGAVIFFGTLTLLINDPLFIKIKLTIIYGIFAIVLLGSLVIKKNLLITFFAKKFPKVPNRVWALTTIECSVFLLVLASVNAVFAFYYSEDAWVNFKTFAVPVLTMLFIVAECYKILRKYGEFNTPTNEPDKSI